MEPKVDIPLLMSCFLTQRWLQGPAFVSPIGHLRGLRNLNVILVNLAQIPEKLSMSSVGGSSSSLLSVA